MKLMRKSQGFTLVEIMIVVAIIGIVIAIAVPGFIKARSQSRIKSCQENLTKIDGSKEQYALEQNVSPGASVTWADLVDQSGGGGGYLKTEPNEPSGFAYTINSIGTDPTCSSGLAGHSLGEVGNVVTVNE